MKNKERDWKLGTFLHYLWWVIAVIIGAALILTIFAYAGLTIWAEIKYANVPINEIPTWVARLLLRG